MRVTLVSWIIIIEKIHFLLFKEKKPFINHLNNHSKLMESIHENEFLHKLTRTFPKWTLQKERKNQVSLAHRWNSSEMVTSGILLAWLINNDLTEKCRKYQPHTTKSPLNRPSKSHSKMFTTQITDLPSQKYNQWINFCHNYATWCGSQWDIRCFTIQCWIRFEWYIVDDDKDNNATRNI